MQNKDRQKRPQQQQQVAPSAPPQPVNLPLSTSGSEQESSNNEFIAHMTIAQCGKLRVNDKVDCRYAIEMVE